MNDPQRELNGVYFDGRSARGIPVVLSCVNGLLQLRGDGFVLALELQQVRLSPRLGRTLRQLALPDGAVCEVDDAELLDRWFDSSGQRRWNLLARLEAHWGMILASALLVFGLTAALAVWGLPWAAQRIAFAVPQTWVSQIGRGTLAALDQTFGPQSKLPPERIQLLQQRFDDLARAADVDARFEFRDWPRIGANAFALPDGTIVMTDQLVALADDDRELLAVVAHELGHQHERHALRQLIAGSGVAGLLFVLTGDVSGLGSVAVAAPTVLTQLQHSRALENDADRFGFALLDREDIDPVWFARIIRKLEATHNERDPDAGRGPADWLSSHPASAQREQAAERYRMQPR